MIYQGKEYKKSDPEFFSILGKIGAEKFRKKYGSEGFRQKGFKGGTATRDKYGKAHYSRIGAMHKGQGYKIEGRPDYDTFD